MTNYVKSTNFASKDSLAQGNPLKIVKGTEIDSEFNNIATAVATKADTAGPTFTGKPFVPTAAYGDNSAQIASTSFVTAALQLIYPLGSIYTNASYGTNPATLFGFGTWTQFGAGKVLVGINGADASFDVLGETGGSKDSVVVSHTHTASGTTGGQSATHTHASVAMQVGGPFGSTDRSDFSFTTSSVNSNDHTHAFSATTNDPGVSGVNANLQPYVVVYIWQRTA